MSHFSVYMSSSCMFLSSCWVFISSCLNTLQKVTIYKLFWELETVVCLHVCSLLFIWSSSSTPWSSLVSENACLLQYLVVRAMSRLQGMRLVSCVRKTSSRLLLVLIDVPNAQGITPQMLPGQSVMSVCNQLLFHIQHFVLSCVVSFHYLDIGFWSQSYFLCSPCSVCDSKGITCLTLPGQSVMSICDQLVFHIPHLVLLAFIM